MSKTPPHLDKPVKCQYRGSYTDRGRSQSQYLKNIFLIFRIPRKCCWLVRVAQCPCSQSHVTYCAGNRRRQRRHRQFQKNRLWQLDRVYGSRDFELMYLVPACLESATSSTIHPFINPGSQTVSHLTLLTRWKSSRITDMQRKLGRIVAGKNGAVITVCLIWWAQRLKTLNPSHPLYFRSFGGSNSLVLSVE